MKAVCLVSGGMDSCTMITKLKNEGWEVHALSFFYGQRHQLELVKAEAFCKALDIPWQKVDLSDVNKLLKGSALSDETVEMPKGHYSDDSMAKTVVASRNTFLLAIASSYAITIGASDIFFGAHEGDRAQYPDCKEEYIEALNGALAIANSVPVKVHAPFLHMDKGDIAIEGLRLGVNFAGTKTCYEEKEEPCLRCGSDVERTSAFLKAGQPDPLLSPERWEEAVKIHNEYQAEFDKSHA